MRFAVVILVIAFSRVSAIADAPAEANKSMSELEVGRQVKIRVFAFGGIGYAGMTSDGEKYFFKVLMSSGANGFVEIFERGDAQAKAYALAGLRWLSDARYDRLRDAFVAQGGIVHTAQGCLFGDFEAAEIAKRIDAGEWDDYITAIMKMRYPKHSGEPAKGTAR